MSDKNLQNLTMSIGFLLILIGLAGYVGAAAPTFINAIPALFGVGFVTISMFSVVKNIFNRMMDLALALSILSAFTSLPYLTDLYQVIFSSAPAALYIFSNSAMLLMSFIYLLRAYPAYRKRKLSEKTSAD